MKSPKDMRIIQIDITNACIHRCSNCTRFCGHHKKPFFMDWETFEKAVNSFEGYKGTVGIMGGEPTLHPEFKRFVEYIKEHSYYPKGENWLVNPTKKFMDMIAKMEQRDTFICHDNNISRRCVLGYGLWSTLSEKYKEYYELIQDTFNFQAVNDHTNIMYHSPIMIRRKDLGISDEEWYPIRDNCWAQDEWSATITPKGAFFCEIAGALDMLFDGPGGWPIEPGWWKRTPDQFGEQLKWCEICGIAINTFTRDANDEIDDMSPWYYNKLKEIGSPKVQLGLANVLQINEKGIIDEQSKKGAKQVRKQQYTENYFTRFNNNWLNPKGFIGVLIADSPEKLEQYINVINNTKMVFDNIVIAVTEKMLYQDLNNMYQTDEKVHIFLEINSVWGACLNRILNKVDREKFIVLIDENTTISNQCADFLKGFVLNPGSILFTDESSDMECEVGKNIPAIFSPKAYALKRATFPVISRLENVKELIDLWENNKKIAINQKNFTDYEYQIEPGIKYALYGVGPTSERLYCQFSKEQIVLAVDSDSKKWGMEFHGHKVIGPKELYARRKEFDKIFVASNFFLDIKTNLLEMGFTMDEIVTTLLVM